MGTQRRYKVPMFDTTYRIVRAVSGEKDETLFGSDSFDEAQAEYLKLAAETTGVLYLMQRSRIMRRSDEHS